jgi:hypothetical protein
MLIMSDSISLVGGGEKEGGWYRTWATRFD